MRLMENIQELYRLLSDDIRFFNSYKENFKRIFLEEFSKFGKGDKDREKILEALSDRIYKLLFSFDNSDTLNQIYLIVLKTLEDDINIKPVLSKTLLIFLKEYIDRIIDTGKSINYVKAFISLIEEYLQVVDKAYVDYIEKLRKELKETKETKKRDELKTVLVLLRNLKKHNQKINVISYYEEVAIRCKGSIKDISVYTITMDVSDCMKKIFRKDRHVFLKIGHKTKVLKCRVREINSFEGILVLDNMELIELPQEKRRFLRVRLKKKPKTILKVNEHFIEGIIDDLSIGGAGIYIDDTYGLKEGNIVEVKIPLGERNLILDSEIIHISKKGHLYKIGVQFLNLFQKDENTLGEFITERQFEILKEIRN